MKVDEEVAKEKAALDEKLSAMEVCISANYCLHLGEFFHVSRRIRVCTSANEFFTSANKFFTSANSGLDQEKYAHENEALRRELEEMTSPGADEQVIRRILLVNSAIYDY